ncbi:hypothetical protein QYE76_038046 [Lolium multiflorum]|uniref:D-isomer specific 2-hydroxyacid dehydrogenase catalytic domain-containing protein n=1 Tax=Lolium multiflorum TaxID=4521 RepID=A0AAD8T8T6_LOLMU|nr:hypothetical protein QYE76_038046 [Lolium multiflorum]
MDNLPEPYVAADFVPDQLLPESTPFPLPSATSQACSCPMASAIAAATAPPAGAKHSVLLLRRANDYLAATLRARYRVLSFYDSGGAPLPRWPPSSTRRRTSAAGLDHVDLAECARRGVLVAGAGEVFSTDVADHAVGLLIDVLRNVSAADRYVRRGLWPVQGDYPPLGSKPSPVIIIARPGPSSDGS